MPTDTTENNPPEDLAPPAELEDQADDGDLELDDVGTPYADAVEEYLGAADWLGPLDRPFVVQARQLARSLDRQLERAGEVQSALASTFDKVLVRLEARRPPAGPTPTDPAAPSADGTASIFTVLDGD